MKYKWIVLVLVIVSAGWYFILNNYSSGRNGQAENFPSEKKIQVITSFYPLYFFAQRIGGDRISLSAIIPPGVEPHDYELTPRDVAEIENSDLVVVNGAGFEPWFEKIRGDLDSKKINYTVLSEGIDLLEGAGHEEEGAVEEESHADDRLYDPHIWLSPIIAQDMVRKITQGLVKSDSENESYYKANEKKLLGDLSLLNQDFQKGLSACQKRDFVTSHAAFAYIAKQYNLNQVSISGISPEQEPSAQKLAEVSDFVKKNDIEYIFFETLVNPRLSTTIANETGAQTLVLDPLEGLSDDDISAGKNYLTVMRNNLKNLQTALQCSL